MINSIETWLTEMSLNGWALEEQKGWKFIFIRSAPKQREYFMYSALDAGKGFWFDYYMAKKQYELKKSKLLKSTDSIFEVDFNKKNEQYVRYRDMRNKYYKRHYLQLLILTGVFMAILSTMLFLTKNNTILIGMILLIPFLYFGVSCLILMLATHK